MAVQQRGDGVDVSEDARDVGGGAEGAYAQRPLRSSHKRRLQLREVWPTLRRLSDCHDVRHRVAPRQEVGVVLVRADENDGALVERQLARRVTGCRRWRHEPEHRHQPVGACRRPGAGEEDAVVLVAPQVVLDHQPRLGHEVARLAARLGRRGVNVAVRWQQRVAHVFLDEGEGSTGGRVISVERLADTEGRLDGEVGTELTLPDVGHQLLTRRLLRRLGCRHRRAWALASTRARRQPPPPVWKEATREGSPRVRCSREDQTKDQTRRTGVLRGEGKHRGTFQFRQRRDGMGSNSDLMSTAPFLLGSEDPTRGAETQVPAPQ